MPVQVEGDIMCFVPKRGYPSNQPNSSQPLICTTFLLWNLKHFYQVSTCGNPFSATVKITSFWGFQRLLKLATPQGSPRLVSWYRWLKQHPTGSTSNQRFVRFQRLQNMFQPSREVQILPFVDIIRVVCSAKFVSIAKKLVRRT